ncbi:hypothetical protein ASPACDRAFT_56986 [Aspergillus aculeatus ATCC 16872]|uniref:DUF4246 domain-containing protein n=1 Tax=Aspergillus aculeatus (strain ATCC 16872 / CBS 172.66 / WB 5094) TaxID=690307 RepID=A0A1L9X554_ASPA1|nr:uncharacterized protein ASPACDRAFT_56986 [Aspergillus aculeatus ATCC 16872]OJK03596.1 hypothetical protein ASPACDRAFT_56986 [Aspergillus aculeatus ATCC 16872]
MIPLTTEMIDWIIKELQYKALFFLRQDMVKAFDEGIMKSDYIVPQDLRLALVAAVRPLEEIPANKKDYHPSSDWKIVNYVTNLPYILEHTARVPLWNETLTPLIEDAYQNFYWIDYSGPDMSPLEPEEDTEFEVDPKHEEPMIDDWSNGLRQWRASHRLPFPKIGEFEPFPTVEIEVDMKTMFPQHALHVIVKLANIELTPEKPSYAGGGLGILQGECMDCRQGLMGLILTFPNIVQHRGMPFALADPTRSGHCKILPLFLVDPNLQIISTANVPPQQVDWFEETGGARHEVLARWLPTELQDMIQGYLGGDNLIGKKEAEDLRVELMEEQSAVSKDQGWLFDHHNMPPVCSY